MFCAKCGARLDDSAKKCHRCGAPVRIRPASANVSGRKDRMSDDDIFAPDRDDEREFSGKESLQDPVFFKEAGSDIDVDSIIRIARGEDSRGKNEPSPEDEGTRFQKRVEIRRSPAGSGSSEQKKITRESWIDSLSVVEKARRRVNESIHLFEERRDERNMQKHIARAEKYFSAAGLMDSAKTAGSEPAQKKDAKILGQEQTRSEQTAMQKTAMQKTAMQKTAMQKTAMQKTAMQQAGRGQAAAQQRLEKETLEGQRQERRHLEKEALEGQRQEKRHLEKEALEKEALEKQRQEKERLEKAEKVRREQERLEHVRREKEEAQKAARKARERQTQEQIRLKGENEAEMTRKESAEPLISVEPDTTLDRPLSKSMGSTEAASADALALAAAESADTAAVHAESVSEDLSSVNTVTAQAETASDLTRQKEQEIRAEQEKNFEAQAEEKARYTQQAMTKERRLWTEEELGLENARKIRRMREDEIDGIDEFLAKYGLSKELAVRLATLFLIALLSVIYVMGRGRKTPAAPVPQEGMTGEPSVEQTGQDEIPQDTYQDAEDEYEIPTGGGDFQNTQSP